MVMVNQTTNNNIQRKLEDVERIVLDVISYTYDVETLSFEKYIKVLFETAGVEGVLNPVFRINIEGSGSDIRVTCILCINSNSNNTTKYDNKQIHHINPKSTIGGSTKNTIRAKSNIGGKKSVKTIKSSIKKK